jgi:cell division protein ZapB
MEADLKTLEDKLTQFIALCQHLKSDNHSLRQELAQAQSDVRVLKDNMAEAESRVQSIIERLPEGTL